MTGGGQPLGTVGRDQRVQHTVEVTVERAGRTASFVRARVLQDDRLRLLLTAIAATAREGDRYDEVAPPFGPTPVADATPIFPPADAVPAKKETW